MSNIQSLIISLTGTLNLLIPLCLGIALLGFIFGVVKYIAAASNPEKLNEAKRFILFSIIALAVMLSVWTLALVLVNFVFPTRPGYYSSDPYYYGSSYTIGVTAGLR